MSGQVVSDTSHSKRRKTLRSLISVFASLCLVFTMVVALPTQAFATGQGYIQSSKVTVAGLPASLELAPGETAPNFKPTMTPSGIVYLQKGCGYCPTMDGCGPGCIDDWGYCSCTFDTTPRSAYLELVDAGNSAVATAANYGGVIQVRAADNAQAGATTKIKIRALIDAPSPEMDANQPNAYGRCSVTYEIPVTIKQTKADYTVNHFQQNLDGTYPTDPTETEVLTGDIGEQTTAAAKTYVGFSAGTVTQQNVEADGSTVVSIQYTRNSHALSFDSQGGSAVAGSTLKFGALATEPSAPTRAGYDFEGWYTDAAITTAWNFASDTMPDSDKTLFAKWTEQADVALSYTNDGHGTATPSSEDVAPATGVAAGSTAAPNTGYHFVNWTVGDTTAVAGTAAALTTAQVDAIAKTSGIYAPATFKANFAPNAYTVTFNANTGSGTMGSQSMTYDQSANLDACTFTKPGYTFTGWATTAGGSVTSIDQASVINLSTEDLGTVELFAIWTESPNVTVSYTPIDAAMGSVGTASESLAPATGAAAGSVATALPGYYFVNWSNDENSVVTTDATLSAAQVDAVAKASGAYVPVTFTANFAACKPAVDNLSITGINNGDQSDDATVTFTMTAVGNTAGLATNPMPNSALGQAVDVTLAGDGSAQLGGIAFTAPGTYTYEVAVKNDAQSEWAYSDDVYTVTYVVTQVGDELQSARTITRADGTPVQEVAFTNTYTAPKQAGAQTVSSSKTTPSVMAKTGDSAGLISYVMLVVLLGAMGAMGTALYLRRRRQY